jgi:RHS repeat-associated protein
LEAFDYQRYETGASPVWTPLRFPGQYYDEETDLFENWNRYYDPSIGRYLQPEPMLPVGAHLGAAYAYAANNPIKFTDPDGRYILEGECPNFSRAIKMARERAGCEANSDAKACKCNKALLCNICDYLDDSSLPRVRPEAMPVEKEKKCFWGGLICLTVKTITTQGRTSPRDGWAEVWVNKDLCEGENNVAELAKTLLHEALHVCVIHARVPGAADEGRVTDAANQCF